MQGKSLQAPLASSLRGRLLFLICLATLPALLFGFFAADQERAATLARIERDAAQLARIASREHARQIKGARNLLSWIGARIAEGGAQASVATDPEFLRALLAGHPQLANIGILAADGRVLASAYDVKDYRSWRDHPVFLSALQSREVVTGHYLISPIFERPTLNHALAVRDALGAVTAVIFNGLDLEWLSDLTRQSAIPAGFSLLVTDQWGKVLAAQGAVQAQAVKDGMNVDGIAELAGARRGGSLRVRDLGLAAYFVAEPMEHAPGVFVAVGLPQAAILHQANRSFARTIAGLGVLTLFTILAAFIAAEVGLLRVLRSLVRTVQRFGAGDLGARIATPRGQNEFTMLAAAFNAMADTLGARHREAIATQADLRALAHRLDHAREAEAKRISRDLHDQVGQVITSIKIGLLRATSHCPAEEPQPCAPALRGEVDAMAGQLDDALHAIRSLASDLRPGVLDRMGLVAALRWQAEEIESRSDLSVQVDVEGLSGPLDERTAVALFRIAQEALTNVVRHAHARAAELRLTETAEGIVLEVRDDGVGFAADAISGREALGIMGMRERAALVGGKLSITGGPGRGTTVQVTLPRPAETETLSDP